MDAWKELRELVETEIEEVINRGEIRPNEWSRLKEATIIAEKAKKIEVMDYDHPSKKHVETDSKQEMINDLRNMLDEARDKRFKSAIRQCLDTLEEE